MTPLGQKNRVTFKLARYLGFAVEIRDGHDQKRLTEKMARTARFGPVRTAMMPPREQWGMDKTWAENWSGTLGKIRNQNA